MDSVLDNLSYELYLAEQEMLDAIALYEVKMKSPLLTESAMEALQESAKEKIMEYIRKVVQGIQKAWNAFISKFSNKDGVGLCNKFADKLNSAFKMKSPEKFMIPNMDAFYSFINNVAIPVYNKDTMAKEELSEAEFIKKYFPFFSEVADNGPTVRDVATKKIFTEATGNEILNKDQIKQYVDFMHKKFNGIQSSLKANISNINNASRTVESALSMADSVGTGTNPPAKANAGNEDNKEENKEGDNAKFSAAGGQEQQASDNKEGGDNAALSKSISTYYKACTSVLSCKLYISTKVLKNSLTLIRNFAELQGKNEDPKAEGPKAGVSREGGKETIFVKL